MSKNYSFFYLSEHHVSDKYKLDFGKKLKKYGKTKKQENSKYEAMLYI